MLDNLIDSLGGCRHLPGCLRVIQDHIANSVELVRELLQVVLDEGLRVSHQREDGIEETDRGLELLPAAILKGLLPVQVEHIVLRRLEEVGVAGHRLAAFPFDALILQDIDQVPDDGTRFGGHLREVRPLEVASFMDGKADERVNLLPLGEVRIVEDPGGEVDHLRVRAVHLRGQAEGHPVRGVHRHDIVPGHPVGFLDDIAGSPAVPKEVGVIPAGGDEGFPSEAAAAADFHITILVTIQKIAFQRVCFFGYIHNKKRFWCYYLSGKSHFPYPFITALVPQECLVDYASLTLRPASFKKRKKAALHRLEDAPSVGDHPCGPERLAGGQRA